MRFIAGLFIILVCSCNEHVRAQTSWSVPEVVATTAGTSSTHLFGPRLAAGNNGEVALLYHSHWATTTGTQPHVVPLERHSDVTVQFSSNRAATWKAAQRISDPSVLSNQGRAIADSTGNFRFAWTSGDPLSGFRLHTATTVDGGASFTTQTEQREDSTTATGYFSMQIAMVGSNLVVARNAIVRRFTDPFTLMFPDWRPVVSAQTPGETLHDAATATPFTSGINFTGSIGVAGTNVVVPTENFYTSASQPRYATKLITSSNEGSNWTVRSYPDGDDSLLNAEAPYVATDGSGKWLLFSLYLYETPGAGGSQRWMHIRQSYDAGITWSEPRRNTTVPYPVCSAATDGHGRWIALLSGSDLSAINYIWSDDNGDTWSAATPLAGSRSSRDGHNCIYMGNGRWAVTWADGGIIRNMIETATLEWGASAVGNWGLY